MAPAGQFEHGLPECPSPLVVGAALLGGLGRRARNTQPCRGSRRREGAAPSTLRQLGCVALACGAPRCPAMGDAMPPACDRNQRTSAAAARGQSAKRSPPGSSGLWTRPSPNCWLQGPAGVGRGCSRKIRSSDKCGYDRPALDTASHQAAPCCVACSCIGRSSGGRSLGGGSLPQVAREVESQAIVQAPKGHGRRGGPGLLDAPSCAGGADRLGQL